MMARPGGGSSIEFGKVKLFSSEESVEQLNGMLDKIIKKHGYPEEEREEEEDASLLDEEEDEITDVEVSETPIEVEEPESPWITAKKKLDKLEGDKKLD